MSSRNASALHIAANLFLVLFLTLPVWAVLTHPGLPTTQVGPLPVLDLQSANQNQIAFPLARLLSAVGVDALASIKISAMLAIWLLTTGVFGWAKILVGARAGVLASVLVAFAPVLLSTLFRNGDWTLLWVMVGLAWAGFGLLSMPWWGLALAAFGAFVATAAHPELALWTVVGLMLLAGSRKRWLGLVVLPISGMLGVILSSPWTGKSMQGVPAIGARLYQLIEPDWLWGVRTLSLETSLSFSLGFALIALLILASWAYFQRSDNGGQKSIAASDSKPEGDQVQVSQEQNGSDDGETVQESPALVEEIQETINNQRGHRDWFWHLGIGLIFVFFSLDFGAGRLGLLSTTVGVPWHLLLLALPFLAVAAVFVLRFIPQLQKTPLWASLLIITILGAGHGLTPDFQDYHIPEAPVAFFGNDNTQLLLLNLETEGILEPGATIVLTADWFSSRPVDFDYNIFVHVVDGEGKTRAQLDAQPQAGARPMTSWLPGEILSDRYELFIPPDASPDLHLRLGLYNWQTGERMAVDNNDALELQQENFK